MTIDASPSITYVEDAAHLDLVCDDALVGLNERLGLQPGRAMMLRRYEYQSGGES